MLPRIGSLLSSTLMLCAFAHADTTTIKYKDPVPEDFKFNTNLTASETPKPLHYGWDNRFFDNRLNKHYVTLPEPKNTDYKPKVMKVREAILIGLRNSPDIMTDDMTSITDKWSYETTMHDLLPQVSNSFTLDYSRSQGSSPTVTQGGGSVTLTTRYGAEYKVTVGTSDINDLTASPSYTLSVSQPLLAGFGEVKNFTYLQAERSYESSRLSHKSTLITQVSKIANAYWSLVNSKRSIENTRKSNAQTIQSIKDDEVQYKAGKLSKSDLVQNKSSLATTELSLLTSEQSYQNSVVDFLQTIGLSIYAHIKIDDSLKLIEEKLPPIKTAIQIALKNNISYAQALLSIKTSQEAIVTARDARRWSLDLTGSFNGGAGSSSSPSTVGVSLSIPINDRSAQSTLLNSRSSYESSLISLQTQKVTLIRSIIQDYRTIYTNRESIKQAKVSADYAVTVLNNTILKKKFGQATQQDINTNRITALTAENSYISAITTYFSSVEQLHDDLGDTLEYWGIKMRDYYGYDA